MTVVFVHGVPVTAEVWTPLVRALPAVDVVRLRLPGFGAALPPSFAATMDGYAAWLAEAIAEHDEVDLVGQDWGGLLVLRVASDRPPNLRSWVVDSPDLDDGFVWHASARRWQTPDDGEELADRLGTASLVERVDLLRRSGMTPAIADLVAPSIDPVMTGAVLSLYRSSVDIARRWGPDLDRITAPGRCVVAGRDAYRDPVRVRALAVRTGAGIVELPDAGHFWMLDHVDAVARELVGLWSGLHTRPYAATTTGPVDPVHPIAAEVIGRREGAARRYAARHGYRFRVARRDDAHVALTMDHRIDRVTVTLRDGVVTEAHVG